MDLAEISPKHRELLKSARQQLAAILEGSDGARMTSELYYQVLEIMDEIEGLLGY